MIKTGTIFHPKCGGPDLMVEEDGRVHVDGLGYITRAWNKNIDKWKDLITKGASDWGVPEAWIAGVMLQESGGTQGALSPAGAVGLMQIMPSTPMQVFQIKISKEDLYKPENNVDIGARLLAMLGDKSNWNPVFVAASYNAGSMYCYSGKNCDHPGLWNINENCGYAEQVVRGINAAIGAGYSGTGAGSSSSDLSTGAKVFIGSLALALPVAAVLVIKRRRGSI